MSKKNEQANEKKTVTLRNYDITANVPTNVTAALNDVLQQRIPTMLGMKIRRINRVIRQQTEDVQAERDRLLEQYPEDGRTEAEQETMDAEWQTLMNATFECEVITLDDVKKLNLLGWTLLSPIVEVDKDGD